MNKSLIFTIYRQFNQNPDFQDLTMECAKELERLLIDNPSQVLNTMKVLQNNVNESLKLANAMVDLFNNKKDLLNVVASAHLYAYLHLQKANFLFAINDKCFAGFKTPQTLEQAYNIIKNNFKVNGWTTGNRGITFTLQKS